MKLAELLVNVLPGNPTEALTENCKWQMVYAGFEFVKDFLKQRLTTRTNDRSANTQYLTERYEATYIGLFESHKMEGLLRKPRALQLSKIS